MERRRESLVYHQQYVHVKSCTHIFSAVNSSYYILQKRSGIGDDDSDLAIPNGTKDSNISNLQDHCSGSGREFLFGFEQQLSQEASRIENGLKKSEGCSEKAMVCKMITIVIDIYSISFKLFLFCSDFF